MSQQTLARSFTLNNVVTGGSMSHSTLVKASLAVVCRLILFVLDYFYLL